MPPDHLLPDRLAAVLAVVYLIFNEGYGGRGELAAEALLLGRALAAEIRTGRAGHALIAPHAAYLLGSTRVQPAPPRPP